MKTKILSAISALALMVTSLTGCHDPEKFVSNGDPQGILKLTAFMVGDELTENSFDAEIDHDNGKIVIVFPYNYPRATDNLMTMDMLKNVRLTASLSSNTTIEPALTTVDLNKTNVITVKNPQGVRKQYTITADIRYNNECELDEIELANGVTGIVDQATGVVTLITPDEIEPQTATYVVSYHATVSPDITTEPFDFEAEGAKITVTAQNGVDSREYTFTKGEPKLLPFGFREGSEVLRWVKRWDEAGYKNKDDQTGFAVTEKYIVLNEPGVMQAVVLKASDGSDTGMRLDMGIIPTGLNFNMTSDAAGHIIVNSKFTAANPQVRIWVFNDINDKGRELLNQSVYGGGDRLSVYGDITKDAQIITPLNGTAIQACRWFIKDGKFVTTDKGQIKSEVITFGGITGNSPWANVDFAPTSATDSSADIFGAFYATVNGTRGPAVFSYSGTSFTPKAVGKPNTKKRTQADGGVNDAGNWVMNACDYVEFNNSQYFVHNSVNTFTWGGNDFIYLLDVSSGDLSKELFPVSENHGAVKFLTDGEDGKYGAMAAGNSPGLSANFNDVRLYVSQNKCYMYCYFLFAKGYIGCFRVDCLKK